MVMGKTQMGGQIHVGKEEEREGERREKESKREGKERKKEKGREREGRERE